MFILVMILTFILSPFLLAALGALFNGLAFLSGVILGILGGGGK